MSSEKNGGNAFPTSVRKEEKYRVPTMDSLGRDQPGGLVTRIVSVDEGGMSLRDYFAAQALSLVWNDESVGSASPDILARCAYEMADAMLRERNKQEKGEDA